LRLTEKEAKKRILARINKSVKFHYPGQEGIKKGILRDRALVFSSENAHGVKYWDIVDLIEFPGEEQPLWLRIGYYRQLGDRLVFAGQTTITEPLEIWDRILLHAGREKAWFKQIILRAAKELAK
jgi:hypothetical protein